MNANSMVSVFAGTVIMASLGIAHLAGQIDLSHVSWLWLTFFVGANLFQMGLTGFCPAKSVFKMPGARDSGTSSSCCS